MIESPTGGPVSGLASADTRDLDSRAEIHDLVIDFYREIALDDLLGPVFGEVAEVDWAVHIPRLIDYWSQVLLGDPGYDGAVLAAHRYVHGLEPLRSELFERWYGLFVESVDGRWSGPQAERAKAHAAKTAAILARRLLDVDWTPAVSPPGRVAPDPSATRRR